jgi:amino acid permease
MFLDESPLSMDLWLRTLGLASLSSMDGSDASEEVMVPPFNSESRRGSATFSKAALVLTFLKNGWLGLPFVFERCGVAVTLLLLVVLAIVTDHTMYIFWICARKTGANTYGGIVRVSYGFRVHCVIISILFLYLLLMVSQSMRSIHSIWTQLFQHYLPDWSPPPVVFLWLPLAAVCKLDFHSLWFMVYTGIISSLAVIIIFHFSGSNLDTRKDDFNLLPMSLSDSWLGFNELLISFVAIFNVLHLQAELRTPTTARMQSVVRESIIAFSFLAFLIGKTGYDFFHRADNNANIPENFLEHPFLLDSHFILKLITFLAILFALPLLLVPCRESLLDMIESLALDGHCPSDISDCQDDIETWTTRSSSTMGNNHSNNLVVVNEESGLLPSIEEDKRCELNMNPYARYGSNVAIIITSELLARTELIVPRVWKVLAPSLTLFLTFIVPASCYITLNRRDPQGYKIFGRWIIITSALFSLVSTFVAVRCIF